MAGPDSVDAVRLGADAGIVPFSGRDELRRLSTQMLTQASREICLLTWDLERAIYGQPAFVEALQSLALRSHQSRVRILLQDPGPVVRDGHPVVELARRLTSRLEIRVPHPNWQTHPSCFLLVDRYGYVRQDLCSRHEGSADFHAPLLVRRLRDQFEEIWAGASVDPALRALHL